MPINILFKVSKSTCVVIKFIPEPTVIPTKDAIIATIGFLLFIRNNIADIGIIIVNATSPIILESIDISTTIKVKQNLFILFAKNQI